jgi:hypothetical protein
MEAAAAAACFLAIKPTTIWLDPKRKMNLAKLAEIIASQKFFLPSIMKTATRMAFPSIMNGTAGAKTIGNNPADKAITLGTIAMKKTPIDPDKAAAKNKTALTSGPVTYCE